MQNNTVFEETKEYFYKYVFKPISGILYAQKIYKDFQASCISNKFYRDSFTDFVDVLYYKTMITELCKQLDTPNKNKQNFQALGLRCVPTFFLQRECGDCFDGVFY